MNLTQRLTRERGLDFLSENSFIVIFLLWCLFLSLSTSAFLTLPNLMIVLRQASIVGIVAIGEALIVLSGAGMDVSLASILGLSGVLVASSMVNGGMSPLIALVIGLAVGGAVGLLNGLLVTRMRINGIIVTLGMMYALEGVAFIYTRGQTIFGPALQQLAPLSRGYLGPIPVPVLLLFVSYAAAYYILNYTVFGAHIYAVGNNERASWLAGIHVDRLRLIGYITAGLLAGFGGVMQSARMGSATGGMGAEFLFPVLTAVILGGVSLGGGRGKIERVLIAAVFLTTINNGLILLNVSIYAQKIISGVILILALSLDRLRRGIQ
jgi:ribose transport system permease protein